MMSLYISRNFKFKEFACPCCGKDRGIDSRLIYLLQNLREKINRPIYISKGGGLRCKKYNQKIGGYKYSPHLEGKAVDIHVKNMDITVLAMLSKDIGFTRIGLYPHSHFIHIDIVRPYRNASWIRDINGKYHYFKTLEDAIKYVGKF